MKVYYCNYEKDINVPFDEAIEMNYDEAIKTFFDIAGCEDNFCGIEDSEARTVQFLYLDEDKWLIDIPAGEGIGSYSKESTEAECLSVIKDFYEAGKLPDTENYELV